MARQDALSILTSGATKDQLAEVYGDVIESIQKGALSERLKNTNYSGDATSGSVEISRFANAELEDKGTARTGGKGDEIRNSGKVTINVDTDKEIVEEVAKKDLELHGVKDIAQRRKANHVQRMIAYLDRQFFAKAEAEGTALTLTSTNIEDKLEEIIVSIEETENDWVDGVPRDMIVLTLKPTAYSKARNFIDTISNPNVDSDQETINVFHGVQIESNNRQTADVIAMAKGSVGQLILLDTYDLEKIPLSNDFALSLFVSHGTKAVTPDLIKTVADLSLPAPVTGE